MRSAKYLLFFLVSAMSVLAQARDKIAFKESISVAFDVSGDITGSYEFAGPLGANLEASASKPDAVCSLAALFRKVVYRGHNSLEMWPSLVCTFDGQKHTYKPYRIFFDPELSEQKIKLPALDKNLKSVWLGIRDLSLSKSK